MVRLLQILVVYFSEIKFKSKLLKKNPVWMNNANKYASHSMQTQIDDKLDFDFHRFSLTK